MKKRAILIIMFLIFIIFLLISSVYGFKIIKGQITKSKDKAEVIDSNFDRVIIELDKKINYKNEIKKLGGEIIYDYKNFNSIAVKIPKNKLSDLNKIKGVINVKKDHKVHALLDTSVPAINADDVWLDGVTGSGVKVAVIDTGFDYNHADVGSKINPNDPLQCYHFLNQGADVGLGCIDGNGHGTHVAGTIANPNTAGSATQYKGVAYGVNLMAIKVLGDDGIGYDSDVAAAVDYAVSNNAEIISMSLGATVDPNDPNCYPIDSNGQTLCSCYDTIISSASDSAVDAGVVVIAASGNDGTNILNAPACAVKVISVGAVGDDYVTRATYSNGGVDLDLVAPGGSLGSYADIISTWWTGDPQCGGDLGCYNVIQGTSMATPHVSGVAALLLEANPGLTPIQIRNTLRNTAVDLGSPGRDNDYGYGRVDAYAAYSAVAVPYPKNIKINLYKDLSYTKLSRFFDFGEIIYIKTELTDVQGSPVTNAVVNAKFYNNENLIETIPLSHLSNGIYTGSFNSAGKPNGVYNLTVQASNSYGSSSNNLNFHVYIGSGISAYQMNLGSLDYIIENQHLISVFNRGNLINAPLISLIQKESLVSYDFNSSSYANTTNKGGLSSSKGIIKLNYKNSSLGEGLNEAEINFKGVLLGEIIYNPILNDSDRTCYETWGRSCIGFSGNTIDSCGAVGTNIFSYIDDVKVDKTVYKPGEQITATITIDCTAIDSWLDVSFIAYYDGSSWTQKWADYECFSGGRPVKSLTFNAGNNPGMHAVRGGIQMGLEVGQTCAGLPDVGGDNDDVNFTVVQQTQIEENITDLKIKLNDEADFLEYNLNNFFNFPNWFSSDISGSFDSISDDRYYVGNGNSGLVSSLTPNSWTDFSSLTLLQQYVAIYDNSSSDNVNDNVLSWVNFYGNLDKLGVYYENNLEGARIKYNTSSISNQDNVTYLLAFTKGSWEYIDDDMLNISLGVLPLSFYNFKCINGGVKLCPLQAGVCIGSNQTCTNEKWPGCNYNSIPNYESTETSCDSLDNDCDNVIDEGCTCNIADSDNDGVINIWDDCPNTPTGSLVNNKGCSSVIPGDVTGDCTVDILDLSTVGFNFGNVC